MGERQRRGWLRGGEVACVAVLLALIGAAISAGGWLVRVDHLVFDLGQLVNRRAAPDDVLIIAVDAESLAQLGRWPWRRDRHARLLQTVCAGRPAVVAINIAFSEKSEHRQDDAALAAAIAACGRVVLPVVIESTDSDGQWSEALPIPELAAVAAGIGRIGVRLDEDGIARRVDLLERIGKTAWPLFAAETLRVAGREPGAAADAPPAVAVDASIGRQHWLREQSRRVDFIGPPGTIRHVSYVDVVDGKVAPETFTGKIVLLGATAAGLGDALPIPLSGLSRTMPGVEIQANIVVAMRDGRLITTLPVVATVLLTALLATMPLLWLPRLMPLPGLLVSTAWVLAVGSACALLPELCQRWLPPSGLLVGGLFAFPLWSWRRLEVASRHLDQELRQLQAALAGGKAPHAVPEQIGKLSFEQRIAAVQRAQRTLQHLQAQRNEALAFISHDLRAPLASVVSQLEHAEHPPSPQVLSSLRRALRMAQTFVSLARAEALDQTRMQDLELTSLIEQAADELYAPAKARGIALLRRLPDDPVWISGDFESLQRSLLNLLENALQHAPEHTAISVGVDREAGSRVRLWVENEGPALPPAEVDRLFQRFVRGQPTSASPSGTGLGLYYVRTVAQAHGGDAGAECAGGRIRFWVRLPQAAVDVATN